MLGFPHDKAQPYVHPWPSSSRGPKLSPLLLAWTTGSSTGLASASVRPSEWGEVRCRTGGTASPPGSAAALTADPNCWRGEGTACSVRPLGIVAAPSSGTVPVHSPCSCSPGPVITASRRETCRWRGKKRKRCSHYCPPLARTAVASAPFPHPLSQIHPKTEQDNPWDILQPHSCSHWVGAHTQEGVHILFFLVANGLVAITAFTDL